MKHSTRGYNQYFVIIILLLLGLVFINSCQKNRAEYTRAALIQDSTEAIEDRAVVRYKE